MASSPPQQQETRSQRSHQRWAFSLHNLKWIDSSFEDMFLLISFKSDKVLRIINRRNLTSVFNGHCNSFTLY